MEDPHAHNSSHILANQEHVDHKVKRSACGDEGVWSDAHSGSIFDQVVLSNPYFLQGMNARAFAIFKCVSKSWAAWFYTNIHTIAHARGQHENSDWYFPLLGMAAGRTELAWSGIWHANAYHSSNQLSVLPSLGYLQSIPGTTSQLEHEILATAEGLLLTTSKRRFKPHELAIARPSWRLVVSNPLTKHLRVLPSFQRVDTIADVYPMHIHMLVDDKANTYKVNVSCYSWYRPRLSILVYDSTSMSWELVLGEHALTGPILGVGPILGAGRMYDGMLYYTSACLRGRIYFADIRAGTEMEVQNDALVHGVLRLFEVDIRDGQCKSSGEFPLRRSHDTRVEMIGISTPHTMSTMHNLELVECMGRIFAVLPSSLHEVVHPWGPVRPGYADSSATLGSKYLPVQFYVLQLDGSVVEDGYLAHGVVRIEIPNARNGCKYLMRRRSLHRTMRISKYLADVGLDECTGRMYKNWFTCTAKGSEIWITCLDYLLQYNIMSREFKTRILPCDWNVDIQWNFDYKPSFHMTP